MKNFASWGQALGQAAVSAAKVAGQVASSAASEVSALVGVKCLRNYQVQDQVTTAGPQQLWSIYKARSKLEGSPYKVVSVWILEKRHIPGDATAKEAFLEICRKDVAYLARLKHPCVVRLVEPFEETRTQLVIVTEYVVATAGDFMKASKLSKTSNSSEDLSLSELEIKHGLMQIAEGLNFLHTEANLVHCGIDPHSVFLSQGGTWKLACFAFARMAEFNTEAPERHTFDYYTRNLAMQPSLHYTAPEFVASSTNTQCLATPAADIFSLGAIMYEFFSSSQLIPVAPNDVSAYHGRVNSLGVMDMPEINYQLQNVLRPMVSQSPHSRPSALSFVGSQFFQDDTLLRALRFLDSMLQRDNLQKAAFLKELQTFWEQFDKRVLRYKVLPPLLQELRNEALQSLVLPLVMSIIQQQERQDFMDFTLPALKPICENSKGETLVLLLRNVSLLVDNMPPEAVSSVVVPMISRAAEQPDPRCQEEALKCLPLIHEQLDYTSIKTVLLPKAHQLCLRTTSAAVRASSLVAMGKVINRMDKEEAEKVLHTVAQVTGVDKSAPTIMCVVGIGEVIGKQWGPDMMANKILPVLTPLLVSPNLSHPQFSTLLRAVKNMIGTIESKRGGELQETEILASHTIGSPMSTAAPGSTVQASNGGAFGSMGNTGKPSNTSRPLSPAFDPTNPFAAQPSGSPKPSGLSPSNIGGVSTKASASGVQRTTAMTSNRGGVSTSGPTQSSLSGSGTSVKPMTASGMKPLKSGEPLSDPFGTFKPMGSSAKPASSSMGITGGGFAGGGSSFNVSPPASGDPFGTLTSLPVQPLGATNSGASAFGGTSTAVLGGAFSSGPTLGASDDDIFKDPSWKDPALPSMGGGSAVPGNSAAGNDPFGTFMAAAPSGGQRSAMSSSFNKPMMAAKAQTAISNDPFDEIFGRVAPPSQPPSAGGGSLI